MPPTVTSLDVPHTHLDPSTPPLYLHHVIASKLRARGFEGCEVGALEEFERLLERRVQGLFAGAKEWAALANRSSPNALDLLASTSERTSGSRKRLISKRQLQSRSFASFATGSAAASSSGPPSLQLEVVHPLAGEGGIRETLMDLKEYMMISPSSTDNDSMGRPGEDVKPSLDDLGDGTGQDDKGRNGRKRGKERTLEAAYEGAPSLPGLWTYPAGASIPSTTVVQPPDLTAKHLDVGQGQDGQKSSENNRARGGDHRHTQMQVTPASLDFVKSTVAEEGIDPELGIVHYKKVQGGTAKKRKWSVRGIEV